MRNHEQIEEFCDAMTTLLYHHQMGREGNPSVKNFDLFLAAEQLALDEKYNNKAEQRYGPALEVVAKLGHLYHLGLIDERYWCLAE